MKLESDVWIIHTTSYIILKGFTIQMLIMTATDEPIRYQHHNLKEWILSKNL